MKHHKNHKKAQATYGRARFTIFERSRRAVRAMKRRQLAIRISQIGAFVALVALLVVAVAGYIAVPDPFYGP